MPSPLLDATAHHLVLAEDYPVARKYVREDDSRARRVKLLVPRKTELVSWNKAAEKVFDRLDNQVVHAEVSVVGFLVESSIDVCGESNGCRDAIPLRPFSRLRLWHAYILVVTCV